VLATLVYKTLVDVPHFCAPYYGGLTLIVRVIPPPEAHGPDHGRSEAMTVRIRQDRSQ